MDKTTINIFSFILAIVGLVFLLGVIILLSSNLITYYFLSNDSSVSFDFDTFKVILIIGVVIYFLFSMLAAYSYNKEVYNSNNEVLWIVLTPLYSFLFITNFFKKKAE